MNVLDSKEFVGVFSIPLAVSADGVVLADS